MDDYAGSRVDLQARPQHSDKLRMGGNWKKQTDQHSLPQAPQKNISLGVGAPWCLLVGVAVIGNLCFPHHHTLSDGSFHVVEVVQQFQSGLHCPPADPS